MTFGEQQKNHDRIVLEDLKNRLSRLEVLFETFEKGEAVIFEALTSHGILTPNGNVAKPRNVSPSESREIDILQLVGELKVEKKEGSKGEYSLAKLEDNKQTKAFQVLQEKIKGKGGFWSKKSGNATFKFWFYRDDESQICWRAT